jgi:glycosyltransferase involved in cell wall biosynthesis
MKPRIVIVSEDLVEPWDEGIKKFTASIGRALEGDHPVRMINVDRSGLAASRNGPPGAGRLSDGIRDVPGTRTFIHPRLRHEVASFAPEVVIYVPSPSSTVASFLRAFALRRHWPRARQGMVALIPRRHPARLKPLLNGTSPDVIFVPSYASLLHLCDLSLPGEVLPVGVDFDQFRPAQAGEKSALRQAHGIPPDAYVYLHVGHLSPHRNLRVLARLAEEPGTCVVVVGSTSTPEDARLRGELEAAGVRVVRQFVPVEEFYRLCDCYVFPVVHGEGSVEIPLSVIEALASGVPVVSRPFGGLRDFVAPGDDVRYAESDEDLVRLARALRSGVAPPRRDLRAFAWRAVAERMVAKLLGSTEVLPS